jgi:hypothetical protein
MSRYFELMDNMRFPQRWHLRAPVNERGESVDPWQFFESTRLEPQGEIRFPVKPPGHPFDFTLASFLIPVLNSRCVHVFEQLGIQEVQLLPAQVEGHTGPYFILNTLQVIRCIDDARCKEARYWMPEDGQPEKVGQYHVVSGLRIDPSKVGGAHIFRTWGWTVALIVSEELKQAMEQAGITGPDFVEV